MPGKENPPAADVATAQQTPEAQSQASTDRTAPPTGPDGKPLSPAEIKRRAKVEKQARRQQKKGEQQQNGAPSGPQTSSSSKPHQPPQQNQKQQKPGGRVPQSAPVSQSHKGSQGVKGLVAAAQHEKALLAKQEKAAEKSKQVGLFSHLYGHPRRYTLEGAAKEVHPAILALGLQMSNYVICGSTARCVAMLLAFKSVIQAYSTPHGASLARHLTSYYLSPQIEYLKSCRPISVSMGNAIRYLKSLIVEIDPSVPEPEAKEYLTSAIDTFLQERIIAADTLISQTASSKIEDGDVILTYAKSSIVLKTLLAAQGAGKRFRVVVLDAKPLFEGRYLASDLAAAGLTVEYSLLSGAAQAVSQATKLFLGAHAMLSNGRLYSRVGTAVVAMLAHERDIPCIVCCESVKFSDKVALDSIVTNEIAPAEELLLGGVEQVKKWKEVEGLQILNILYDVTPAEYVKMVVTEYGSLPPSSVPAVLRYSGVN